MFNDTFHFTETYHGEDLMKSFKDKVEYYSLWLLLRLWC
jgi:hypothetical protein